MDILVVAEKPSIAEAIANALSNNKVKPKPGKFPVWIITSNILGQKSTLHITCTTGHIFNLSFQSKYNNWENTDPLELFSANVVQTYANTDAIANHLSNIAKGCDSLTLALDNDREGENICFEVISIVSKHLKSKDKGLGKNIFRARFSSLVKCDIIDAFKKLGIPNKNESDAVMARQEIDLKLGCAFTRFQTLSFQDKFGNLNTKLISYGPCQTPTLFFCVERFKQIKSFQPQTYYRINAEINVNGERIHLTHSRGHIFNLQVTEILRDIVKEEPFVLTNVHSNVKTISRPMALNTVNLLKLASQQLHMGPHHALSVAEKLYLSGFISYPRTETTAYPENFDTNNVFNMLKSANFPQDVFSGSNANRIKFNPNQIHRGKDAGDHPPITPVSVPNPSRLSSDELNIYSLIVRNFLASISLDCKYKEEKYSFNAASETFIYTCTRVIEHGFTLITNKSAPAESSPIAANIGDSFRLSGCDIKSDQTTPPSLLSESDLLELMEKNGIGTDASMATHINNICLRGYVKIIGNRRLEPTKLGLSLVYGYLQVDPELVLPTVRGNIESLCDSIATGKSTLEAVISHSLEIFRLKFIYFTSNIDSMVQAFMQNFTLAEDLGVLLSRCGVCNRYMVYVNAAYPRLVCKHCDVVYKLPSDGTIKLYKEIKCPLDNFELVQYQSSKGGKSYTLCPMCYNDPPFEDFTSKSTMNCSKCPHPTCINSLASIGVGICECEGGLYFDMINQGPKWRILCNECQIQYTISTKIKLIDSCQKCDGRLISIIDKDIEGCFNCSDIKSHFTELGKKSGAVIRGRGGQGRRHTQSRGRGGHKRGHHKTSHNNVDPKMTFHGF